MPTIVNLTGRLRRHALNSRSRHLIRGEPPLPVKKMTLIRFSGRFRCVDRDVVCVSEHDSRACHDQEEQSAVGKWEKCDE